MVRRRGGDHLPLFAAGDRLLQVTGASQLTVLTEPHTGSVPVAVTVTDGPPDDDTGDADAAAEATVWCPHGWLAITGLMLDGPATTLGDLAVPAGLVRIRVTARDRAGDSARYRVVAWPVTVAEGFRTLGTDGLDVGTRPPNPAEAAAWAVTRLVDLANPGRQLANLRRAGGWRPPPADEVRVAVRRTIPAATARLAIDRDLDLPAGELRIRLAPDHGAGHTATWRWFAPAGSMTAVPDAAPSTVTLVRDGDRVTLTHDRVRAADAVLLGLVWDHLLTGDPTAAAPPWEAVFSERATRAEAERRRHAAARDALDSRRWGGRPPGDRLRAVAANTIGLAGLDRDLLDALAEASPATQRRVAAWAARAACAAAGLDTIDWVAPALAALDAGTPLPAPFDDDQRWRGRGARTDTARAGHDRRTPRPSAPLLGPGDRAAGGPGRDQPRPLAAAVDTVFWAALARWTRPPRAAGGRGRGGQPGLSTISARARPSRSLTTAEQRSVRREDRVRAGDAGGFQRTRRGRAPSPRRPSRRGREGTAARRRPSAGRPRRGRGPRGRPAWTPRRGSKPPTARAAQRGQVAADAERRRPGRGRSPGCRCRTSTSTSTSTSTTSAVRGACRARPAGRPSPAGARARPPRRRGPACTRAARRS